MTTKSVNQNPLMNPLSSAQLGSSSAARQAQGVAKSEAAGKVAKAEGKEPVGVTISDAARERNEAIAKARDIAMTTPDIREDRVADIKARLAAGTYQIDAGAIADGMLREAVKEHLSLTEGQ